jgi:hypothetical protein
MGGILSRTFKKNEMQALLAVTWFQYTKVNFPRKLLLNLWRQLHNYKVLAGVPGVASHYMERKRA